MVAFATADERELRLVLHADCLAGLSCGHADGLHLSGNDMAELILAGAVAKEELRMSVSGQ